MSRPIAESTFVTRRDEILALLEDRPYATQELAELLSIGSGMHQVCTALARAGLIVRVGGDSGPWALPGAVAAADAELYKPFIKACPLCGEDFTPRSNRQRMCIQCRLGAGHRRVEEIKLDPAPPGKGSKARLCEGGCGKRIVTHLKKTRCPDCQLQVGRDRAVRQLEERRQREAETTERLLRIEEAVPEGDSICERCGKRFLRRGGAAGRFCTRTCYERPVPPDTRSVTSEGIEFDAVSVGGRPLTHWPEDSTPTGTSLSGRTYGVRR